MDIETIDISVPGLPKPYRFWLAYRKIKMGRAGEVEYCWFPIPDLRQGASTSINVDSAIKLWWDETQLYVKPGDMLAAKINLVLAELYLFVARDKGPQSIFVDAYLGPPRAGKIDSRPYALSADEWQRLRSMAQRRDVPAIRREFERLFLGVLPTQREMRAFNKAFERWMLKGVAALDDGGRDGLRKWIVDKLLPQMREYRRRGRDLHLRQFINMVSYEARVAFFTCYANAWSKITPWLAEHRGLSTTSQRFLCVWHCQNSAEKERDVLCGHVLALHPLSARIMGQEDHRVAIGEWLYAARNDPVGNGTIEPRAEYWNMVATVLAAGHEYCWLREAENAPRRRRKAPAALAPQESVPSEPISALFAAYAEEANLNCPFCHQRPVYVRHTCINVEGERTVRVVYRCMNCGWSDEIEIESP